MALEPDEVRARWPELAPLLAVVDPPWRFDHLRHDKIFGARLGPGWTEVCYVADRRHVSVNRGPIGPRPARDVRTVDFTGSITDAVDLLASSTGEVS